MLWLVSLPQGTKSFRQMERPRDRENCTGNNKTIRQTRRAERDELNPRRTNLPQLVSPPSGMLSPTDTTDKSKYYIRLFILRDVPFNLIVFLPEEVGTRSSRIIVDHWFPAYACLAKYFPLPFPPLFLLLRYRSVSNDSEAVLTDDRKIFDGDMKLRNSRNCQI